jgi:hypothetical protein
MANVWIGPIFAGLLGTTVLTLLISLPRLLGMKSVDMVSALGGLVSGERVPERAFLPGLLVHYALGLVFAALYLVGFRAFGFPFNPLTGAFVGVFHGGLAMVVVETIVFRRHPRGENPHAEDNEARFAAAVQFVGHILYGAIVAGIYGLPVPLNGS